MFAAEHMGVSQSQASPHLKGYSCAKQNLSEETPGCGDTNTVVPQSASSEDAIEASPTGNLDPPSEDGCKSSLTDKVLCPELSVKGPKLDSGLEDTHSKLQTVISELNGTFKEEESLNSGSAPNDAVLSYSQLSMSGQTLKVHSDGACGEASALIETSQGAGDKHWNQVETPSQDAIVKSRKNNSKRSLTQSDRLLRSRSQEKPKAPESCADQHNVSSNLEKTRKKKKKKRGEKIEPDEYSRIRKHLRYLLNRINYEQSLITAYSAEGWKGLSLEKLKPEKELQRATSEILRRKSKIRDLFQRIDELCAEGRFPESLFDTDGQISSEDIFCAKCGSKDFTADNDIILCDGACDRGFHQYCLMPPLLKEDIPPDDEGWLCPGCDCKADCIGLVNVSQGANVSISDNWEKVFPEAAATGENPDQNFGLPSDDSDDDDFDPDKPDIEEKSQGDESSSDDSDSDFTSDELETTPGDKQHPGHSSEDSEDDAYDPDAPDLDENVAEESSSSDFTSDSEDLAAAVDNNDLSGEKSKRGRKKKQNVHDELLSTAETNLSADEYTPINTKRNVERLDYKILYDETYGNAPSSSSSSDDEDFTDTVGPMKRKKSTKAVSTSANGNAPGTIMKGEQDGNETTNTSKGNSQRPPVYKRLGETVTQGLYKSFKENQYPNGARKESLAKELGITFHQVNKWFMNARWSFNHPSSTDARTKTTSETNSPRPETVGGNSEYSGAQSDVSLKNDGALVEIYVEDGTKTRRETNIRRETNTRREIVLAIAKTSTQQSKTPKPRKRKHDSDNYVSDLETTKEKSKTPSDNSSKDQETSAGGRRATRRKSVA
ncbi:homeobox protein HAT3.1 [Mercurialis annua]|uniref:homeobox protein HAT3.1 n=1 Tax=Mercurialis annua TaxID=3986 RepID=UPI00215F4159|nr:homeobox protein HAT3.1 [Mercurialis annua]XP_050209821.1 homeobox protein HAT3.1 [Mercurialis annua]